jgi:hypothetical protein
MDLGATVAPPASRVRTVPDRPPVRDRSELAGETRHRQARYEVRSASAGAA